MRWPRLRIRGLMVAVGIVALLVWGGMMGSRSRDFYRRAERYARAERQWREMAVRDRGNPARSKTIGAVWGSRIADYYAPLAHKYRQAMWRPWLPVAPDPLAPGAVESPGP